ncbi:hypothetical protein, partial [Mesorhizobium sp.]|uniref:hypothetical protein n=1 Tax=Mesorhizobium sp. TaxID=1871066 RepID=UPI0025E61A1E
IPFRLGLRTNQILCAEELIVTKALAANQAFYHAAPHDGLWQLTQQALRKRLRECRNGPANRLPGRAGKSQRKAGSDAPPTEPPQQHASDKVLDRFDVTLVRAIHAAYRRSFFQTAGETSGRAVVTSQCYAGGAIEQFQEKCETIFLGKAQSAFPRELRKNKEIERFGVSMKR